MAEPATVPEAPAGLPAIAIEETAAPAPTPNGEEGGRCTQAQLRRFIKSRPYVPMHELRRRFELNGQPDDVSPVTSPDGTIWIGLPPREAGFVGELLRQGEIGLELCHDPVVRIVVGVFAMRPIAR
ncbi:MAG: hypothetical protein U0869_18215 [Chloroflexota bacterium]